jgi:hypothetical protein
MLMTNMAKLRTWLVARKQRKAHERYLQERAYQQALHAQDVQESVRDAATSSGAAQQAFFGKQ